MCAARPGTASHMNIAIIVPAAGTGSRFGGGVPKQFQQLIGKPILQHVVERFLLDDNVTRVVVPVAEMLLASIRQSAQDRVKFVAGGETRQESVIAGLAEIGEADIVAIHDAARPLFSIELFHRVIAAAAEYGASLPAVPLSDTVHVIEDEFVSLTLDRSSLGAAQTPQAFRTELLKEIVNRAVEDGITGTDEAGLAVRYGYKVRAVAGDPMNFKITHPLDLIIAETYLQGTENVQ